MEYFNTHPYMASFIIGSIVHLESKNSKFKSKVHEEEISALKIGMMGPLAAIVNPQIGCPNKKPAIGPITIGLEIINCPIEVISKLKKAIKLDNLIQALITFFLYKNIQMPSHHFLRL